MADANNMQELQQWFQKALDESRKTLRKELQTDLQAMAGSDDKNTREELLEEFKKQQMLTKELSQNIERHVADQFSKHKAETMKLLFEKQIEERSKELSMEGDPPAEPAPEASLFVNTLKEVSEEVRVKVSHAIAPFFEQDESRKTRLKYAKWYHWLDTFVLVVVCASIINMLVEMEWEASKSEASLGWGPKPDPSTVDTWNFYFRASEHVFNAVFLFELITRIYLDRCAYFLEALNLMDFTLVMFTSVQLYILDPMGSKTTGNLSVFRFLRMARFIRAFRFIKMAVFTDLRVLITTCVASLSSLFWSMVLLFMIMFVSSLLMCNLLTDTIQDTSADRNFREWAFEKYGSTARAAYTMFEITMSGGWPGYFNRLVYQRSGWFALVAVTYVTFVVFAVIRIISAIFLKQTLQVASKDSDMQATEAHAKAEENGRKLRGVFEALDASKSGLLTREEFFEVTSHPDVMAVLTQFELQIHDIQGLFDLLDNGDGMITYDEFIKGVMRLKGQARSLDVIGISRNTDKIQKQLNQLLQRTTMVERMVLKVISSGDVLGGGEKPASYSTI